MNRGTQLWLKTKPKSTFSPASSAPARLPFEPTAGLDPKERVRFRNLIDEIGKESIVLLSTHIVSDIEHIADHIIMMKNGQIIWQGSHKEIEGDLEDFYMEQFDDAEDTVDSFTVSENSGDLGDFRKRGSK